jgi:tRNA (guanine10-N2)-dimethyltransferase
MMHKFIFDLSKEYPLLAHDEVIYCLNGEHIEYEVTKTNENTLILNSNLSDETINHIASRLSMTFSIGELLFESNTSLGSVEKKTRNHPIEDKGSLAVRYKNRSESIESKPLVQIVASVYTKKRLVDLSNPDQVIFLLITPKKIFVSDQIAQVNRSLFEQRKAQFRPFFSPISLHPKIARSLVNISQVNEKSTVLDPFCGTGGILLEAGLMNTKVIGSDISEDMVSGTRRNLSEYHIDPIEMIHCDIGEIPTFLSYPVDAVVTDFPYGKSTSLQGESLKELYTRSFTSIQQVLKPMGRAVIGSAVEKIDKYVNSGLNHVITYPIRVHRSLTRYFHVFEKAP